MLPDKKPVPEVIGQLALSPMNGLPQQVKSILEPLPTTAGNSAGSPTMKKYLDYMRFKEYLDTSEDVKQNDNPPMAVPAAHALQPSQSLLLNLQRRLMGELAFVAVLFLCGAKMVQMGVQHSFEEETVGLIIMGVAILVGVEAVGMFVWQANNPEHHITIRATICHDIFMASGAFMTLCALIYIGFKFRENPLMVAEVASEAAPTEAPKV